MVFRQDSKKVTAVLLYTVRHITTEHWGKLVKITFSETEKNLLFLLVWH